MNFKNRASFLHKLVFILQKVSVHLDVVLCD